MELKDTIELMNSKDYKERFIAEYLQLKIRYNKLKSMCEKWDRNELDFEPTCSRGIYNIQLLAMITYLDVLEKRAKIEKIDLERYENQI